MNEESETDLSKWEQASTKRMICYSSDFLISGVIGGTFRCSSTNRRKCKRINENQITFLLLKILFKYLKNRSIN
jgi:hypothetical protein